MRIESYRPRVEWYLHDASSIHGVSHAARVFVWAGAIGDWMGTQGEAVDMDVVRWAAALHDVRRVDDARDPPHGQRAADWIRANRRVVCPDLDDAQADRLAYCCLWHVPDDEQAPELTPELVCLKDADGLDRVRLGDLQPRYLRTARARSLVQAAQTLHAVTRSERGLGAWEAVTTAALRLDLVSFGGADASTPAASVTECRSC